MLHSSQKLSGFCKTWKSLLIVSNLASLFFTVLHLVCTILYPAYGGAKLGVAMAICHVGVIQTLLLYVKNYNILMKEEKIKKTYNKMLIGLVPILIYELINVVILIFHFI